VINQFIVDSAGQFVKQPVSCGSGPAAKEVSQACLRQLGYQISLFYQPANRFWTFQAIETMIFLTLTAGLIALTFWWIKHRVH
jgi:hypothetical protein